MGFGALGAYAFVAPVVLIVLRAFVVGPVDGGAGPVDVQPQDEGVAVQTWLSRQVLFFAFADALPLVAFFQVLVWGSMPLLWLVSAEYVLVMLFYFPHLPAGLSGRP